MLPAGFEPAIPACERLQTHAELGMIQHGNVTCFAVSGRNAEGNTPVIYIVGAGHTVMKRTEYFVSL
jgi:hypothetical protein